MSAETNSNPELPVDAPPAGIHIVATAASVETSGVTAMFALDSLPAPMWRGAFSRSLEGKLRGSAGRWYFDRAAIAVSRVEAGHAADVANAVQSALTEANGYLSDRAERYAAVRAAAEASEIDLRRDATDAAAAMHAALGV